MQVSRGCWIRLIIGLGLIPFVASVALAQRIPAAAKKVGVAEHLGRLVPALTFTDSKGGKVDFGSYLRDGRRPTLISLNYYRCPMLCTLQLNALVETLKKIKLSAREDFRIVTVSIDPNEGPELAKKKREGYLALLGDNQVNWEFFVGSQADITALADTLGFQYAYDKQSGQFAHAAMLFVISPQGKVARYLYGTHVSPKQLEFALVEGSAGRLGSPIDKVILSCFRYDASTGKYSPYAWGIMRLMGIVMVAVMGTFVFVFWRRERRVSRSAGAPPEEV
ncbi:MAG: SCO family protein [Deltaproteobacteria bacterium]|nr:SCO family protein [Deltaproteobacteria bacterium]